MYGCYVMLTSVFMMADNFRLSVYGFDILMICFWCSRCLCCVSYFQVSIAEAVAKWTSSEKGVPRTADSRSVPSTSAWAVERPYSSYKECTGERNTRSKSSEKGASCVIAAYVNCFFYRIKRNELCTFILQATKCLTGIMSNGWHRTFATNAHFSLSSGT